jgi:integrase/recombinase XerD
MRGLYQRNGIYWARFKVRGQEYRLSLRTRSERVAERRLKAERERIEDAAYFGSTDPVGWPAAVVSWRGAWNQLEIKPSTGARYVTSLAQVRAKLDGQMVHEIDIALLKEIVRWRSKQGVSNATIRRDMTAISSVLGHCVDEGWIDENPAHMMDRSRFKERKAKIILPRPDSIGLVFAERSKLIDMAALSLETGMRQDEIAGLERDRLDRKRSAATLEDTKSGGVREVPLSAKAWEIIDRQAVHIRSKLVFWKGDGDRFNNVDSDWYAKTQRIAQKAARDGAEFRRFRFHDLRHLFAVRYLRDQRGTIYDLKEVLGHESVKTTERYLDHLTPDERLWATHGVTQKADHEERSGAENG